MFMITMAQMEASGRQVKNSKPICGNVHHKRKVFFSKRININMNVGVDPASHWPQIQSSFGNHMW